MVIFIMFTIVSVLTAIFFGARSYDKIKTIGFNSKEEKNMAIVRAIFIGIGMAMLVNIVLMFVMVGACTLF